MANSPDGARSPTDLRRFYRQQLDELFEGRSEEKSLPASDDKKAVVEYKIVGHTSTAFFDGSELDYGLIETVRAIAVDAVSLIDAEEVRIYRHRAHSQGAIGGFSTWTEIVAVSFPIVVATGGYIGKKAIDLLSDLVKAKLAALPENRSKHSRTIVIYGPDDKPLKHFKVPTKEE